MGLKRGLQKKMQTWVVSQMNGQEKDSKLNIRCPWPYLIYEPKKPDKKIEK